MENFKNKEESVSTASEEKKLNGDLDVLALGIGLGVACGAYALFLGLVAWLFGWGKIVLDLVSFLYIGYSATPFGTIIGTIWGFIDGFIGGVIIAWVYNKARKFRRS